MTDINAAVEDELDRTNPDSVAYDDETVIWQGRPSQWINFGTFLWWIIILIAVLAFQLFWSAGLKEEYSGVLQIAITWSACSLAIFSVLSMLYAFLSVYYEHTVITRNKIKEAKGITSIFRQELYCEISEITDIKAPPAGVLGLLGLSTLVIETNDDDQPIIRVRAIPDREELIEKLQPVWRKLKIDRKGYFGN